MAKLTVSFVGGGTGGQLSLDAVAASEFYQPAALADLRPEVGTQLGKKYPELQTFTDFREMFQACPTNIVCVSTYPPSHELVTLEALKLPLKAILVEKPLGHTVASGRRILEAVKQRNIPMAVPHGLMVKRCPLQIIERTKNGEIGELKLVEIQSPAWDILNAGIHWLNFAVNLNGRSPAHSVLAACDKTTRTFRDGMQVETVAVTYVQMVNGVRIAMQTGDTIRSNGRRDGTTFRIIGTAGQIEFWGWHPDYFLINPEHPEGKLIAPAEEGTSTHQRHLENLLPMIDSGAPDYSLPESSLMALEICEAAYLSARHGVEVKFPLNQFEIPPPNDWEPGQPYFSGQGGRDGRKLP
ncbi:MAG: Gfo/Idh/MocA family oxidoreductase [Verrucomicrobia bacterium]|nr:Gfo/Idh/MocA family oxidoreductase [Verrucomicrobiota bacterium]